MYLRYVFPILTVKWQKAKAFIIRKLYGLQSRSGTEYEHYEGGEPFRDTNCAGTMSVITSRTPDRLTHVALWNLRSWAKSKRYPLRS
jgi:hypothetical protein